MSFIYLMPGNWFELKNINPDKIYPYGMDSLKEEILNQVNNRSEKLELINSSFGSKHNNNIVESITFHLNEKKFSSMIKMLGSEKRHPIITFHGTSLEAVNSILATSYIIPGANKNKTDTIIKTHGSMYGTGIYSSPFFDKAMQYTTAGTTKYVYILINVVFLGTMKLIPPNNRLTDFKLPVNGKYSDNSNTRIVYGLEQLISADPDKIVPVAVMKIKIA